MKPSRSNRNYKKSRNMEKTRLGTSLVELVLALSISISVLSTATMLLHRMFSQQQIAKADASFHIAVDNLAYRFRTDVEASSNCAVNDEGNRLELTGANGITTYQVEQQFPYIVLRESQEADGKQSDSFSLVASSAASFAIESLEHATIARLRLRLPDPTLSAESPPSPHAASVASDDSPTLLIEAAMRQGR